MGLGMKTIWISLRAMNYTDRAFRAAITNLDSLNKAEKKHLKNMLQMKQVAQANVQAGMLYSAMAGMMVGQLAAFMMSTAESSEYMRDFVDVLDEAKAALAETFVETLRPVLDVVKGFLNLIGDSPELRTAVVVITVLGTAVLGLYGASMLLKGISEGLLITRQLNNYLMTHQLVLNKQLIVSNNATAASAVTLGTALAYVGASAAIGLMIFFGLRDVLGPMPAILLAVAGAMVPLVVMLWKASVAANILTGGILAIAGLAALGGAMGMMNMAGITNFQMGTRSAPYTGPMIVHKGEVIYNPATERPTGIAAELRRGAGPSVTHQKIEIGIEHLHTEASFDEVDEKIARTLRRKMRNSR